MNKRIIAIILFIQIFSTGFISQTYAQDEVHMEDPTYFIAEDIFDDLDIKKETQSVVDDVYHPFEIILSSPTYIKEILMNVPDLCYFYQMGTDIELLSIPNTAYAFFDIFRAVECEIEWRYDSLEKLTPGRHLFLGDVVLPEGYAFEDEVLTASVPLIVYDMDSEPTEKIEYILYTVGDPNIVIPLGATKDDLPQYFEHIEQEAYFITEKGDCFIRPLTLNFDLIDTHKEGVYYPIILDLPGGVTFDQQESHFLGVHVISENKVVLDSWSYYHSSYYIKWLYPAKEPVLWASVDDGEWHEVETEPEDKLYNIYGCFSSEDMDGFNVLELFFNYLPKGHIYKFQVQYDTIEFSNVLILDLINNNPPSFSNEKGGARTGADREESTLPSYNDYDDIYFPDQVPVDLQDEKIILTLPTIKWDIYRFNYIPFAAVNNALGHFEDIESITVIAEEIEDLSNIPMGSMEEIQLPMETEDTEDMGDIFLSHKIPETSVKKEISPSQTNENTGILPADTSAIAHSETDAISLKDDDRQVPMDTNYRDSWMPTILAGIIGFTITVAFFIFMNKKWREYHG